MEGWNSRRSLGCHCSGARGTDLLVRLVRCLLLSLSLSLSESRYSYVLAGLGGILQRSIRYHPRLGRCVCVLLLFSAIAFLLFFI